MSVSLPGLPPGQAESEVMTARLTSRSSRTAALGSTLLIALTPALSACGGADASAATGTSTLKWTSSYFPKHWDPVVSGSGAQFRELALVYASLTRINDQGKAVPDLAQSWNYNSKGDQVVFHVRPGLKFSDGTPLRGRRSRAGLPRACRRRA